MNNVKILPLILIFVLQVHVMALCNAREIEVGVIEKLGQYAALDLGFTDEQGDSVTLKGLIHKPTILSFVYFRCPSICPRMLSEMSRLLEKLDLRPGIDYDVITISFDPSDTAEDAADKKRNYIQSIEKDFPDSAWHFLTGDVTAISQITESVGYRFKKDRQDFIHPSALIILSPDGKVIRYLMGLSYLPFDVKMALIEAAEGRVGPTINKVMLYCFSYDPQGRTYTMNITKITGTIILFLIGVFVVYLIMKSKARNRSTRQ